MLQIPFNNYFYYHFAPDNKDELIEYCLNAETTNESFDWGDACRSEKEMLVFDGWNEILQPSIEKFLCELTTVPVKAYIDEIWRNKYTRGSFQEIHHHHGADISFTIFCDDFNETSSEFYFYNENSRYMDIRFRQIMEEAGSLYMDDSWTPEPMKGDIIFFPSYFLHGVSVHKNDNVRTTVSGNMLIDKA